MEILTHEIGDRKAILTCYLQKNSPEISCSDKRPAVLIFPGGGYEFISDRENQPIALSYSANGFQAFTLCYSIKEHGCFPLPQEEAFEAMQYIYDNAESFCVDKNKISVVGFSAGGHLAASVGVHWNNASVNKLPDRQKCKPYSMILAYPCITSGEYAYAGLNRVHCKTDEQKALACLENYVSCDTPPTFLCHTSDDTCVPVMNSLLFASSLAKQNIPFELKVYKSGPHGLSLATKAVTSPYVEELDKEVKVKLKESCKKFSEWFMKSVEFIQSL